ncbi:MBL fold metallo-hydrolase [Kineosporia succinea]|uniref:Glyoxylase-like metal-dependent hydrolase (Beta-lactamase superfamily II) n=1 Tax=Kineosporia succinea TaxID=84632 RepID=A0ABT9NWW2_9ACTN|nr:MBL fold metallo-hydrolase [Kineosporia succinea]MDP9824330.1 glyoxylase-like metal-dependent hydrolase (beta-lactamase superfamily II) [Kineosporia succinea]
MLVLGFPSEVFGTNCYVLAPAAGEECVIVDPGVAVVDQLAEVLTEHRLKPAAVVVTHGHVDHVFSVTPVCGAHGVALTVHEDDRYRLKDPLGSLPEDFGAMLRQQFGSTGWKEPDDVRTVADGERLAAAGLDLAVVHAPGHTEGSVMFALDALPEGMASEAGLTSTLLSGDVLFAGSIGRTDLPGGDSEAMNRSLRERVLPLDDSTLVLPGHGSPTTIGRERRDNPFLRAVM